MMSLNRLVIAGAVAALGFAGSAFASVINVDFNTYTTGPTYVGLAAAPDASANTYWNGVVSGQNKVFDLSASDGTATSVKLAAPTVSGTYNYATPLESNDLLYDYVDNGGNKAGTFTMTLENVADLGQIWNVYLYAGTHNDASTFTIGADTTHVKSTTPPATIDEVNPWVEGETYVVFTNVTPDANGDIAIHWTGPNSLTYGAFNGLQIATAPEPATGVLALLGLGALVILPRRKRRKTA